LKSELETKEAFAMESSTKKEAYEEDKRLNDDLEARKEAIAQEIHLRDQVQREFEAREEGKKEGRKEGREERRKEGIKEVIINMHKKQFSVEAIADATNLSVEDILRIVKSDIQ